MTGGFARLEEVFIKVLLIYSSSSEQQGIAAIYRKYGKCEYIKYSTSVGNNDMQSCNKKGLTNWFIHREST
jgi:hypothetical protein